MKAKQEKQQLPSLHVTELCPGSSWLKLKHLPVPPPLNPVTTVFVVKLMEKNQTNKKNKNLSLYLGRNFKLFGAQSYS